MPTSLERNPARTLCTTPHWHLLTAATPEQLLAIVRSREAKESATIRLLCGRVRWLLERINISHGITEPAQAPLGIPVLTAPPGRLGFVSAQIGMTEQATAETQLAVAAGLAWVRALGIVTHQVTMDLSQVEKGSGDSDGFSIALATLTCVSDVRLASDVCVSAAISSTSDGIQLGPVDGATLALKMEAAAAWGYRRLLVCRGQVLPFEPRALVVTEIGPNLVNGLEEIKPFLDLRTVLTHQRDVVQRQRYEKPHPPGPEVVEASRGKRGWVFALLGVAIATVLSVGLYVLSGARTTVEIIDPASTDMVQRLFDHEQAVLDRLLLNQPIDGLIPPLLNIVDALAAKTRDSDRWKQQASLLRQVFDGPDILTESGTIDVPTWSSLVHSCESDQRLKTLASIGHEAAKRLDIWSRKNEAWYLTGTIQSAETDVIAEEKNHWLSDEDVAVVQRWLTLRRSTQPQSASIRFWHGLLTLRTWKMEQGPELKDLYAGSKLQDIVKQRLTEALDLTKVPRLSSLSEPRRELKDILTLLQTARAAQLARRVDLLHDCARDLGQVPVFSGLGSRLRSAYVDRINELLTRGQAWTFRPSLAFTFTWGEEMGASMADYYDHAYSGTHFIEVVLPAKTVLGPFTCDVHYRAGEMDDLPEEINVLPHEPLFIPLGVMCSMQFYEKKPHRVRAQSAGTWPGNIKDEKGQAVLVLMNEIPPEATYPELSVP